MSEKTCMNCGTSGCDHKDARRCANGHSLWTPMDTGATKDVNTVDGAWQLYDAERMANERLRQQLAKQATEIEQLKAVAFQAQNAAIDLSNQQTANEAYIQQLRKALRSCYSEWDGTKQVQYFNIGLVYEALTLPHSRAALERVIAKADRMIRIQILGHLTAGRYAVLDPQQTFTAEQYEKALRMHDAQIANRIRAMKTFTLEDMDKD